MTTPIYLAVHVPEFPAQALLRLRPDLLRKPCAVLRGTPPLQQVCSANAPARAMGVQTGMTLAQLDTFPDLQILPASTTEETNGRNALMEAAAIFTPRVEAQVMLGASFAMVLDMTGTQLMWGAIEQSIQRVLRAMQGLRFTTRLAVSSNVKASLCLAWMPQREPLVVAAGDEAKALALLPLSVLSLRAELTETFALWGLKNVGQLAALPIREVVARLGREGRRLHAMAHGTEPHLLVPEEVSFSLEERVEFEAPVDVLDSLLFVLGPILDQLIKRASNRSYSLASITTHLRLDGGGEHVRCVRPALPARDRTALLKLLQLDIQAHPPAAGILAVRVTAEPGDRHPVQAGFFAPQLPEPMRLDVTLARIGALVGTQNVGRARLLDTHNQTQSFAVERFIVSEGATHRPASKHRKTASMVIRRCRPVVPLRVHTHNKPHAQRPLSFHFHGKLYTVAEAYGPWRRSGDWWSAEVWSYEEWDVYASGDPHEGNPEALLCVLRHDLLHESWTMEGLYD